MRKNLLLILFLLLASLGLVEAQSQYRSPGTGVTVDLSSATNWQIFSGGSWIPATAAPTSLASGSTILIQANDTWANASTTISTNIPAGVTLTNGSNMPLGSFNTSNGSNPTKLLTIAGTLVFAGTTAQLLPSATAYVGQSIKNLTINNTAGVSASTNQYFNLTGILYLQSGQFTCNNNGGTFYFSGSIASGAGSINASGFFTAKGTSQNIKSTDFNNGEIGYLTVNGTTDLSTSGPFTITHTLNLKTGTLTLGGALTINASGTANLLNINTAGGIVAGSNQVIFNGSAQQAVQAAGFFTNNSINNLSITNTHGVTYPASLAIGSSLAVKLAVALRR